MESIWNILELEPTRDATAIKRAYARLARKYHPEENPELFLKLRRAYQAALAWAEEASDEAQAPPERPLQPEMPPEDTGKAMQADTAPDTGQGWFFPEELPDNGSNPFLEHEANRQFVALYSGRQRRNPKSWMDYFTSPAFLEAAWDPAFPALLLQNVTEMKQEYPPSREFLAWLYIAYQFTATVSTMRLPDGTESRELRFHLYENARFDGMDPILRIAAMGPVPKRPAGNELALLSSFSEYRHLMKLAENGSWGEQAIAEFSQVIRRYVLAYLKDKCVRREMNDVERHPAGLRIITYFFEHQELPEELYRILWKQLDLKNAVMGRTKLFYGRLRELVLEHVPGIENEAAESFLQLHKDFTTYGIGFRKRAGGDPEKDKEEIDAFFAREDFRRALKNRRFVEENILGSWVNEYQCEYFLRRIIDFYSTQEDAPCARQVTERARQMMRLRSIRQQKEEDKEAPVLDGSLTLAYRPFFRHWLNTGFYLARDPETGRPLLDYLNHELPWLAEWSRRFLSLEDDGSLPVPKCLAACVDGMTVEIRFHLRYMDFRINGEPVYRPVLPWNRLASLDDSNLFFFLLPIAVSAYDRYEDVREEILTRLADTAAPDEGCGFIASCLAGQACCLPVTDDPEKAGQMHALLPFELFMEDAVQLYGCSWFEQEQALVFFEQTATGRRISPGGEHLQVCSEAAAVELAGQLLEEAVSPSGIHAGLLDPLPEAVYAQPDFSAIFRDPGRTGSDMPKELLDSQVTAGQLETLFTLFADGKINRLELSWACTIPMDEHQGYQPRRSLVLIKDPAGFACLYFDDSHAQSYALLAEPRLYWTSEHVELNLLPFRQGRLFSYNIHHSFSTIRRHLDTIFRQAARPGGITLHAGRLWSSAASVRQGRHKYNLDKQLLGGFPAAWAHNRLTSRFYFSVYPAVLTCTDHEGQCRTLPVGNQNRDRLQQELVSFIQGKLAWLRLAWEGEGRQQHMVLMQDNGRFMMAFLDDGRQQAEFHVADTRAYMDVEGKKYPKDTFLGRTTPAYLIHSDLPAFRNGVELLLARMDDPSVVTGVFAAFAPESPVKPRPYAAIRAELVGET